MTHHAAKLPTIDKETHSIEVVDGILVTHMKKGVMDRALGLELMEDQRTIGKGHGLSYPWKSLVKTEPGCSITREGVAVVSSPSHNFQTSATAIVTRSWKLHVIANIVTYLVPTGWARRHFVQEDAALSWLRRLPVHQDNRRISILNLLVNISIAASLFMAAIATSNGQPTLAILAVAGGIVPILTRMAINRAPQHIDSFFTGYLVAESILTIALDEMAAQTMAGSYVAMVLLQAVGYWLLPFRRVIQLLVPVSLVFLALKLGQGLDSFSLVMNLTGYAVVAAIFFLERKSNEAERIRRECLENEIDHSKRLAAISSVTSGLMHDVRSPLTVIMSRAQRILRNGPSREAEKIKSSAERIKRTINNFRLFSRAGMLAQREYQRIIPVLNEVVEDWKERAEATGVKLVLEVKDDIAPYFDRDLVERALSNLIDNALDAYEDNQNLKPRKIDLALTVASGGFAVTVTDRAGGIPEKLQKKVFEPFYTTKDTDRGTGLGLYNVRQIMESHEGHLELVVQDGGTSFVLTFEGSLEGAPAKAA